MSAMPAQDVLLGNAWALDPAGVSVEVAEVMYRHGEARALEPPLTLAAHEVLAVNLPLHEAEFGAEAFSLLVMTAVPLDFCKQPPIWEGCDAVAEGEVGGGRSLEEPPEPSG